MPTLEQLEEYATNMLELYQEEEHELRQWPIRVDAEEDSVEAWFTYRVS
jgi:hypothetical protein